VVKSSGSHHHHLHHHLASRGPDETLAALGSECPAVTHRSPLARFASWPVSGSLRGISTRHAGFSVLNWRTAKALHYRTLIVADGNCRQNGKSMLRVRASVRLIWR
jgi:hypothetical protein